MNNNEGELTFPYEIKDPADDVQEQFIKDFSGKLEIGFAWSFLVS